ncbi:hypothetical protein LCGC14_2793330 [marine sediment metagenome]|uniref:NlpC/P60 domain-containing protein n=1 Tax=marine sediment metagenome TaxID=412755 RepID=A0A0F9BG91_9ZZZZ
MTTREAFIQEARSCIGLPFNPQGAQECGVHCLGIFVLICSRFPDLAGIVEEADPYIGYTKPFEPGVLMRRMVACKHLEIVRPPRLEVGNLLLIRFDGEPQHMVLIIEPGIILNARGNPYNRVVDQGLPSDWPIALETRIKALT